MGRELGRRASTCDREPLRCLQRPTAHHRDRRQTEDEPAMNWEERTIRDDELADYLDEDGDRSLVARVAALIDQQRDAWPALRDGYEAFKQIETRHVRVQES